MSKWRARALEMFPHMRTEVESAESVGALWIELMLHLDLLYSADSNVVAQDRANLFRAVYLYATWCRGSESPWTQEVAAIEFYDLPRFALQRPGSVYKDFIQDLVANLPFREIETMCGCLQPVEQKRFLADVRQAEDERRRRSQKRSG